MKENRAFETMEALGPASAGASDWAYSAALFLLEQPVDEAIMSILADLQEAPVTMIAWLQRELVHGRAVLIHDVTALPQGASATMVSMPGWVTNSRTRDSPSSTYHTHPDGCFEARFARTSA